MWVQFNDGSQLVVQAGVSCITYTSPEGRITRYEMCSVTLRGLYVSYVRRAADVTAPAALTDVCLLHRYKENEKLPEHVKEKLHCLSTILGLLANPTAHHLQPH